MTTPRSLIVTTWAVPEFVAATNKAWRKMMTTGSSLDAVVAGATACEELQCDGTVGYGGSPDETGETTLDAMVMYGPTAEIGAVAGLRRVKEAAKVALAVLKYSEHTLLVGDAATRFAIEMGFTATDLHTNTSLEIWHDWQRRNCQPNFRKNVVPDPRKHCGPYKPMRTTKLLRLCESKRSLDRFWSLVKTWTTSHDTIGIIGLHGDIISVATSTNGARHKIPGRIGDSPIPGAGAFADNDVGAATATGDGDLMMRLLPSYQTVENMRNGMPPAAAAENAVKRLARKFPSFSGAVVAVDMRGRYGAACSGMSRFGYAVRNSTMKAATTFYVPCIKHRW